MSLFQDNDDKRLEPNEEIVATFQVMPWGNDDKHFLDIVLIHDSDEDRYKAIEWNGNTYPDPDDYSNPAQPNYNEEVVEDYASITEIQKILEDIGHTVVEIL